MKNINRRPTIFINHFQRSYSFLRPQSLYRAYYTIRYKVEERLLNFAHGMNTQKKEKEKQN